MDDALPSELLLLAQAFVQFGTSQSDAAARAVQARLAATDPSRAARFTPQACMQLLDKLLAAEGVHGTRLSELKGPNARTSIKLARKLYIARLAELRDKLGVQEEQMKTLLAAEQEIQNGSWDEKLTQGYELVTPSDEPTQALYKHRYSAGTLEDAQKEAAGEAYASRADSQAELTIPSQLNQSEPPLPKEEAASPAKELHFADEAMTPSETSMHNDATSTTHPEREGAVASILQDVPEEDEEAEIEAEGEGEAGKAQKREEEEEIDRVQEKKIEQEGEASAALTGSRQTRRSAQPISTKGSAASASKGSAPERRSSSRVSRSSIANLSEIIPSTSSDAAEMTITSPPPTALLEDEAASPTRERDTVAPSSESMDVDLTSMVMEREDSKDSTVGQAIINTGTNTTAKRGRPPRKSSVPPVAAKDANKRKRTTTPQAQNKATSPAPSDRSRSKRVKTEEPESGLGTPVEADRTPGSSDASAIRRFRNSAPHLISQMISSVNSTYFKEPVRPGEAKNYFEIIKKPMDLKTLLQNVKNGKITNSAEFTRDLALIFANAIMYNGQDHHVGQDAVNMWKEAQGLLRVLEAAEQRAM